MRTVDEWLFLMDFGAGDYEGSERLTSSVLPPGTAPYRSPEAWEQGRLLGRYPHERYVAGPADDVFALGVMAYRLVTDAYPPFTDASMEEGKCWRPGSSGPLPPRELNPRVGPELDAVIRRMLSLEPEARGTAKQLAEQLERGAEQTRATAPEGLFEWEPQPLTEPSREGLPFNKELDRRLRRRDREAVRVALERDAARRERQGQTQPQPPSRRGPRIELRRRRVSGLLGVPALVAGIVLAVSRDRPLVSADQEPQMTQRPAVESQDGGVTYVGDTATTSAQSAVQAPSGKGIALEAPPKPLPGQLKPDGNGTCRKGLVALNGGCWLKVEVGDLETCRGMRNGIVFKQSCYAPIFPTEREPTSDPIKPQGSGP